MEQNIEEIYQAHSKTVYRYLFCLCHNESLAEELTQETFYLATKNINQFRNECKIQVWLCQIAKNLWFKELKRIKKLTVVSMDTEIGEIKSDLNLEDEFIESEERAELYKQLKNLDGRTRELIYLRLTTELTFKDVAQLLGKSETWARVTFYRWKEKLREMNRKEEQ
ncbi:MAG: sigma-70 family RNA polymerase sigma factor [Clostridia bacterium]|nr:sigma-70 family RNA polymerase sigma factor [Clostridia bacterium]